MFSVNFMQRLGRTMLGLGLAVSGSLAHAGAPPPPFSGGPANLDQWGTGAHSGTLNCASFSPTCGVGTTAGPQTSLGPSEENFATASSSSSVNATQGSSEAHAQIGSVLDAFNDSLEIARHFGQANANANGIATASSFALNGYQYVGAGETKTLDLSLTGTVNSPSGSPFNHVAAEVFIIDASELEAFAEPGQVNYNGYFGELFFPIGFASLRLNAGEVLDTASIQLDLAFGDQFYIFSTFSIGAGDGGSASSMNSFDMAFNSNNGLESVSANEISAIPLPAAAWLMLSAVAGLLGFARRQA